MLVKEGTEIKLEEQFMNTEVASIWVKVVHPGSKNLLICGVYQEHQFLHQPTDFSKQPAEQLRRWEIFMNQVEIASRISNCQVIGYFNMDFRKWSNPEPKHSQLVNCTKNTMETTGFSQLITEITRSWPGQVDSTIDHFWTNSAQKIIKTENEVKSVGDHNLISASIRIKGGDSRRLETRKRRMTNLNPEVYR